MLLPVFICAIVRVVSLGTWIVLRRAGIADDGSAPFAADTLALSLPLMSLAFLVGLLSWRLYAADALLLLAQRLRAAHTTEERRSAIAKAVMDPCSSSSTPGRAARTAGSPPTAGRRGCPRRTTPTARSP